MTRSRSRPHKPAARRPKKAGTGRAAALASLDAESRLQLQELIRRRLALPLEERMNFLRRRLPGGGSCL